MTLFFVFIKTFMTLDPHPPPVPQFRCVIFQTQIKLTNIFDIIKAIMKTEDDKTDGHAGPVPVCRC